MELATPEALTELQSIAVRRPRHTRARSWSWTRPRRRCQCGQCKSCLENARWERIFNEKFADPNYYSGLAVRYESPLHSF